MKVSKINCVNCLLMHDSNIKPMVLILELPSLGTFPTPLL